MPNTEPTPEEYLDIADKVRSGEYFREARAAYDLDVHDPMTDRYWYILLTVLAVVIMFVAVSALDSLYPLKRSVPFIFGSNDIVDDLPHMKSLLKYSGESPDTAVQRFLVTNYVKAREEYDIKNFDRNQNAVHSQSSPEVTAAYEQAIDPRNAQSPFVLYQRQITRFITVAGASAPLADPKQPTHFTMQVVYDAVLKGGGDGKASRFQADIAFKYEGIKLDETSGKVKPYGFLITGYSTKRL